MTMIVIFVCIIVLTLSVTAYMVYRLRQQPPVRCSNKITWQLVGSGMLAFIADTLGVGSFAVNIALAKLFGTFSDEELPAMNNGAQLIPGAIESLFFMQFVEVDLTTLVVLVLGTCAGGLAGGGIVARMSKQTVRLAMMLCFSFIIALLVTNHLGWLPVGGTATALYSWKLVAGFFGVAICGALTSVGIGLFAMVQAVLFVLGISPLVAFPIMMTAGAMQQPLTTFMFLRHARNMPIKRILWVSFGGCLGVAVTLPVFQYVTVSWLHGLLVAILSFNLVAISRTYLQSRLQLPTVAEA